MFPFSSRMHGKTGAFQAPGVGVDLGISLLGTAPLDFLSHRLQHLDCEGGSIRSLLDNRFTGLLKTIQTWFWRLGNSWHFPEGGELTTLEWWAGRDLQDRGRSTFVGLSAAVWGRLELRCPR